MSNVPELSKEKKIVMSKSNQVLSLRALNGLPSGKF